MNGIGAGRAVLMVQLSLAACGCAVGPDFVRPTVETPADFKEWKGWKSAEPKDEFPRDNRWEAYADENLDALMEQVNVSNQNIKQAEAQYRAARALVRSARAAYFPVLSAEANVTRAPGGTNVVTATAPTTGSTGTGAATTTTTKTSSVTNLYSSSLDASWELDIWGKLRRMTENASENMKASAADLGAARLSAQTELAQDYFQLRQIVGRQLDTG